MDQKTVLVLGEKIKGIPIRIWGELFAAKGDEAMKIGIIVSTDDAETCWNALRERSSRAAHA